MGFGAEVKGKHDQTNAEIMSQVRPEDLLKFGLIPEFIGRLPITVACDPLDEQALIDILVKPRNALVKQYQKLLKLDNIDLTFDQDALSAIAKKALARRSGARGLRSIIEDAMLDTMFSLPSRDDVASCTITRDVIEQGAAPTLTLKEAKVEPAPQQTSLLPDAASAPEPA